MRQKAENTKLKAADIVNHVMLSSQPVHKAITLTFVKQGKVNNISFLLDTGSAVSIVTSDCLKHCGHYVMRPAHIVLRTANNETLNVRGQVDLTFSIQGHRFTEQFIVCDDACNCLLSLDWLQLNGASWNFDADLLMLIGLQVKLQTLNDKTACTRRIQVTVDTNIPARHRVCVPVRLKHNLLPTNDDEVWLSETKTVYNSLITARSVTNSDVKNYIEVVNPTCRDVKLGRGANLGVAVKLAVMNNSVNTSRTVNTNAIFVVATDGDQTSSLDRKKMADDDSALVRIIRSSDVYNRPAEAKPIRTAQHNLGTILETSNISTDDVTQVGSNCDPQDASHENELRQSLVNKMMDTITIQLTEQNVSVYMHF